MNFNQKGAPDIHVQQISIPCDFLAVFSAIDWNCNKAKFYEHV